MKILLVDVYTLTKEILTHIISDIDESEIIGEVGSSEEAVKAIDELKPDTVILDMDIAEGKGSDRIIKIKKASTQVKIFVFSMDPNSMHKKLCVELDVDAYLEISHDFEKIRELLIDENWKEHKSQKKNFGSRQQGKFYRFLQSGEKKIWSAFGGSNVESFKKIEGGIEKSFGLRVEEMLGGSIRRFHKDPRHVETILQNPRNLPLGSSLAKFRETRK